MLRIVALGIGLVLFSTNARAELFRVALSTKDFGYLPLFVGMRSGLFAQEGLEIQWIVVNSNVVVTALIAGEIDVAGIAGSSMRAAARGAALKANFFPYDKSLFVLMGASGIKRVQDLKGKVIGTTGPGATTEVAASMMTGPLTGNGFTPGGTKMTAVYLSPLTGNTLGRGATSGYWATYLKAAGYDGIILNGASVKPVYLYIKDGRAELRDASKVWGLGTRDTEDRLRGLVRDRDARVLCIGPAGENLNRAAMLANDYNHFAAHSGGAVLGSKKLKAIVVSGTLRPSYRDKERLVDAGVRWRAVLQQHDIKKKKTKYGHADCSVSRVCYKQGEDL